MIGWPVAMSSTHSIPPNGVVGRQEALRLGPWKLVRTLGFDVESDPLEQRDRASEEPEHVNDLRARLDRWLALAPPGGAQGVHWPHPGWMPPADYNAALRDDEVFGRP